MTVQLTDSLPPRTATGGRPHAYAAEAATLRTNPYKWGRILTAGNPAVAASQANNIRRGKLRSFEPAGAFEAAARGCDVWARYLPTPEADAA
ncbi:hypothetical protein DFR76_10520 [Nocardia pseudobrasiliensis]|uniref:Uncharacterized protein n=1 Tax=Nocardia pseudobrasiliensis TaxID=45979 RepID=A0A370I4T0_9NOCA|nr:hypothetical protein DFR76_10520 [Nocardia pseudobrasiliensis]